MNAQPENGKDAWTRDQMQKIANLVNEELPQGWGFFVMAFPMQPLSGRMNYISNAQRDDIHTLMREFLSRGGFKAGHH